MSTPAELHKRLQNAIDDAAHDNLPDGVLPIGWVMVAELVNPEGDKFLQLIQSRDMTIWNARGILEMINQDLATMWAAQAYVDIETGQESDDEEEED